MTSFAHQTLHPPTRRSPASIYQEPNLRLTPARVKLMSHRVMHSSSNHSIAQKAGLRHERRMHQLLSDLFPRHYLASPWFQWSSLEHPSWYRWSQPDALWFPSIGHLVILEAKLHHTPDCLPQLYRYDSLMRRWLPSWHISLVEVIPRLDPSIIFPRSFALLALGQVPTAPFSVLPLDG